MDSRKLNVSIIIPSYNPDKKLAAVISELTAFGFDDIIIVNDGSRSDCLEHFPKTGCTVLTHERNFGKGAALKTAFAYFLENRRERDGVVTVDGDNQHRAADIYACAEKMLKEPDALILGVRSFDIANVPKKSALGNRITSFVFKSGLGLAISDTQTGLRAISRKLLPIFQNTAGQRFEYETNMLIELKNSNIPFVEVPIETVYIEENKSSHFNPFFDSVRIYARILKFFASSALSSVIDILAFFLLSLIIGERLGMYGVAVCTAAARIISSALNFFLNKKLVFKGDGKLLGTLIRYYALALLLMMLSAGAVSLIKYCAGGTSALVTTLIKAVCDTVLLIVSFNIQKKWVFGNR